MIAPASPVTTNGLVFALSTGQSLQKDPGTGANHATMYVLDGSTGRELFSTGNDAATFSHRSGLALANGRVYFTTHDNTVYCYGLPADQPQLTER
jgi:outer membrane protein assembly factor BamB